MAITFKATLTALPISGAREGQRYKHLRGFSREVGGFHVYELVAEN